MNDYTRQLFLQELSSVSLNQMLQKLTELNVTRESKSSNVVILPTIHTIGFKIKLCTMLCNESFTPAALAFSLVSSLAPIVIPTVRTSLAISTSGPTTITATAAAASTTTTTTSTSWLRRSRFRAGAATSARVQVPP